MNQELNRKSLKGTPQKIMERINSLYSNCFMLATFLLVIYSNNTVWWDIGLILIHTFFFEYLKSYLDSKSTQRIRNCLGKENWALQEEKNMHWTYHSDVNKTEWLILHLDYKNP